MENILSVILAAGEGTRMKSKLSKVLHTLCGKPLVKWVVDECFEAGSNDICLVIGNCKEQLIDYFGDTVSYAVQNERLGTGHAVLQALDEIKKYDYILILCGDTPLIKKDTLKNLIDLHINNKSAVTIVTSIFENPTGYGRIVKENGNVVKVVEQKDASKEQLEIKEINAGMYIFNKDDLVFALSKLENNNAQNEYYLTDTVQILNEQHKKVDSFIIDETETFGINNRVHLEYANKILQKRINENHMLNGVTIVDCENTYIDDQVTIGIDTVIFPGTYLKAGTAIGSNCEIGPNTTISNSTVGDFVSVVNSVVIDSKIGKYTTVGPFAYLRPHSEIGEDVKIGDFVEVKNSKIGNHTKVSHLTYIGDAEVGKRVNFGCGTVTVNYDGAKKFKTTIEDDVFIGCNTNLIAPVTVRKNAYIAAGSTINKEVPENALAIARARQENKLDWENKKKK